MAMMPRMRTSLLAIAFAALPSVAALQAPETLELPSLFSDHMVLQRDKPIPIWGWSPAGEEIRVRLGKQKAAATTTDTDGRWKLTLQPMAAGGPHKLTVRGKEKIVIEDVLIGEVWLASGQSNMAMNVQGCINFDQEKAAADLPQIRMFSVPRKPQTAPQDRCGGDWQVCSPDTIGRFSATAYFFGRKLHEVLDVPVGLINSSVGGTAIEAWTSMDKQKGVAKLTPVFAPWTQAKGSWDPAAAEKNHAKRLVRWEAQAKKAREAGTKVPRKPRKQTDPALSTNRPANLFNGMISPVVGYGIRGAIWYQGERNSKNDEFAKLYRHQLPMLVADWRERWGQGDFPFLWVQLPNFKAVNEDPGAASSWALMRESMLLSLKTPNTGMAVAIDVGDAKNIHPKNKQAVGQRLAQWALAETYGQNIPASGPLYISHRIQDGRVTMTFERAHGLRTSGGQPLKGFAIAGQDRQWHWAQAKIEGRSIVVWHPQVKSPVAVRYAFGDNPQCNLENGAGLPASPFRTDDW